MAKKRARKTTATMLDKLAVAAGSRLGQVAARIDKLTKQRNTITAEIQRYAREAESALRGLAGGKRSTSKARPKRVAKKKSAAKTRRTTKS
jgi:predicted phage gp36 major capsid-like protein